MKVYQDFYLRGDADSLQRFKTTISEFINSADWMQKIDDKLSNAHIIIEYIGESLPKARVFIYTKEPAEFRIGNIVPLEKANLIYDEYNWLLNKCAEDILIPCAKSCGLFHEISPAELNIDDLPAKETIRKLKLFSGAANKSTGSSHPADQKRWNDFICESIRENDTAVGSYLGRWLVEEEGWDDEIASELVIEYENGTSLLTHFKENYL